MKQKDFKETAEIKRPKNPCHLGYKDDNGFPNKEIKGLCTHSEEEHHEGSCWHVTQPDLEGEKTTKQFCPCSANDGDNHRRYDAVNKEGEPLMGYMEPDFDDYMITKSCKDCGNDVLLNLEEEKCSICKNLEMYK